MWNPKVWETILGRQKARELLGLEDETPSEKKEQTTIIVKKRTGTKVEEDADKFDPVKLVEDIITSDYDPRALSLVDDRDLPRPGNPITFLTDPKFMGIKPFPRQLQIASEFWSAYCPYCSDTRFIRKGIQVDTKLDEIWDRMVLYRNGICPKCGKTRAEAIEDGDHNFYGRLVGVAGQRSGKSVFVSMIAAVHTGQFLMLPDIHSMFGLLPSVILHGTFVGLRYTDAVQNLWDPYFDNVTNTPWFKQYIDFLHEEGNRIGKELVKINGSAIAWAHKRMLWAPAGPDKRMLRGRCVTGNTLVSTSRGLIQAKEASKLVGSYVRVAGKDNPIIGHEKQAVRKVVLSTRLENGIRLNTTEDHRIPIYDIDSADFVLKHAEDILGEYAVCQLGGAFPEQLKFSYVETQVPRYIQAYKYIADGHEFTMYSLAEKFNVHPNSVRSHLLRDAFKDGVLNVFRSRDSQGHEQVAKYTVNSKFSLDKYITLRSGVINNKKQGMTIPKEMTPELARLIGYLLSDGWINGSTTYSYWTTSKEKYKDFCKLFKSVFHAPVNKRREGQGYGPDKDKPCYIAEFSYKEVLTFFDYLGVSGKLASTKEIPWCILQAPRSCVLECVSAMLSSDGGLINRSDHVGFYYSSRSKKMVAQLQQLIMRLGYACTRRGGYLKILRYDSVLFLKEYTGLDKRDWRVDSGICAAWSQRGYLAYRIPGTSIYVRSELNKAFGVHVPAEYKRFIDVGIMFSKVVKQRNIGLKKVYDIQIDSEDHLFPANGVLVHNTRIFAAGDEVGWFFGGGDGVKYNWDEVQKALGNSLMTIRPKARQLLHEYPDMPNAIECDISSPSSKLDPIMRAYKQSQGSKVSFGWKYPTWEVNPNIRKEDLAEEFRVNPIEAERDFGANPPFSTDPYIKSPASLVPLFKHEWKNSIRFKGLRFTKDSLGGVVQYPAIEIRNPADAPCCLSLDCGYNCVTGTTLIPTSKGLLYIKDMISADEKSRTLDLICGSHGEAHKAVEVLNKGVKQTYRVVTKSGLTIKATQDHKFLVLRNNQLEYIPLIDLKLGDFLCSNMNQPHRVSKLPLSLSEPTQQVESVSKKGRIYTRTDTTITVPNKPSHMTPSLAYLIGAIVSEGSFNKYQISIANSDPVFLDYISKCSQEVFGLSPKIYTTHKKGDKYKIHNTVGTINKDVYRAYWCNSIIAKWLQELGLKISKGRSFSKKKSIPWSILQADEESQKAFTAAYIEADGSIEEKVKRITIWSSSPAILHEFQCMLQVHGIYSSIGTSNNLVTNSSQHAVRLLDWIRPYLSPRYGSHEICADRTIRCRLPIESRFFRQRSLSYEDYRSGVYNDVLDKIRREDENEYVRITTLLDLGYIYSPIVSIEEYKKTRVFDIRMSDEGEHAFIANGLIVHNCNSFAISLHHWVDEDGEKKIVTSGLLEIIPDPNPIDYVGVYRNVIGPILEAYDVRLVVFDRWQSINLQQQIYQDYGIDALQYSVNMDDFELQRSRIYAGEWLFCGLETRLDDLLELNKNLKDLIDRKPFSHLFLQFLTSKDTGRTVTKGDETTDDLLRACVLGTSIMLDDEYASRFDGSATNMRKKYIGMALGISAARSIGSLSLGSSVGSSGPTASIPGVGCMAFLNTVGTR